MSQDDRYYATATTTRREQSAIDEGLRSYMLGVYNYMALGVAGTAAVTLFLMSNPALMMSIATGMSKWVLFAGILALGWFSPRIILSGNVAVAHGAYWLYCAMWGALLSPMVFSFFGAGKSMLVLQALAVAAATFGAMSLLGYTTKRDMTGWGGFLSMSSIGVILAMLISIAFITDPGTSTVASFIISSVVVVLFSAVTAYETQQIKAMYIEHAAVGDQGMISRSSILGSFMLYGSFVVLFAHILNILGILSDE